MSHWKEREQCPYYKFVILNEAMKSGMQLCNNPDPEYGRNIEDNKHCDHGKPTGTHSEIRCRWTKEPIPEYEQSKLDVVP